MVPPSCRYLLGTAISRIWFSAAIEPATLPPFARSITG